MSIGAQPEGLFDPDGQLVRFAEACKRLSAAMVEVRKALRCCPTCGKRGYVPAEPADGEVADGDG
jgi:hypothetical protein